MRRLDAAPITAHFRDVGANKTYLTSECNKVLSMGAKAVRLFVMPKYQLRFTTEKEADMQAMLALGLAISVDDGTRACSSANSGRYSVFRHMYLRRTYATVYIVEDGSALDCHKHFVEGLWQQSACLVLWDFVQ